VDDGFALIQAFRSPDLSVRGVSVVFGNAPLGVAFPIGQRLVKDFGPPNLPIFRGASSAQELGRETAASQALAKALLREPLTIVAIGPVTNIATVIEKHPELARRVNEIIAVAGRRPKQRFLASAKARPFRDFNFEMDPEAFRVLLNSGVPLVLVPWEISSKVWLHEDDLEKIGKTDPSLRWVIDAASDWLALWKQNCGVDGFNPFDTLAVGYMRAPSSFSCESLPVTIRVLPDDTPGPSESPASEKPYLIAGRAIDSNRSALYCYQAPTTFASELVQLLSKPGFTAQIDHSRWDKLLKQYVTPESRVNYDGLRRHGLGELDSYLRQLAAPWPDGMSQNAVKAALIDGYNALTVRWVLSNYPTSSIWSTDHPFQTARHTIDGRKVSLDQIEKRLRSMHDPRIHSALVCAARSCPPLRREAYVGDRIDQQLDDNVRRWLANSNLNEFVPEQHVAKVSEIFDWYRGDFNAHGGVRSFLATYAALRDQPFLHDPKTAIAYKTYRWGLNDSSGLGKNYSQLYFYWDWTKNGYLYQRVRTWFFGLGQKYGINPLAFGGIYVGAIPFFSLSIAWLIRNLQRHKSPVLPLMCASFCFVSAYLYLLIAGKNIPYWVYGFVALMLGFGIYSTLRKIRSKLRERRTS
jgi:pyrimidine-specific ribonucleoside hydrolase